MYDSAGSTSGGADVNVWVAGDGEATHFFLLPRTLQNAMSLCSVLVSWEANIEA